MSNVTFAKARHIYESYSDLWKLVDLSGFSTCFIDEIPGAGVKDNVYIIVVQNGEWDKGIQTDARVIFWCLEWIHYPPVPGVSEVWHMDAAFARRYGLKYVPVGGHAGLMDGERVDGAHYDVAFLAYMIPRRQRIHYELQQLGVALSPTSAWKELRHSILCNSTAYLHIHQLDHVAGMPALRLVVAAAYKLPFIMEDATDYGIFDKCIYALPYHSLAACVKDWTTSDLPQLASALQAMGERLYQKLCVEYTFRRVIEDAL